MLKTNLPAYIKLDDNTRPQDDFYAYVCKHWLENNPLPQTKKTWGVFDVLNKKVEKQLQKIIEDWIAANSDLTAAERQVIVYYKSLVRKDDYQKNSLRTLQQSKQKIETVADNGDGSSLLAELFKLNTRGFFVLDTAIDLKDSSRFCLAVIPSPLDLPDRDYYLSDNAKIKAIRQGYLDFLKGYDQKLSGLGLASGLQPATILEIETALAKLNWPKSKARDRIKTYNPYSWKAFQQTFEFDWSTYFETAGIETEDKIVVTQPSYLTGALRYLKTLPPQELRNYLLHKFMLRYSSLLNEDMADAQFAFFGKILAGVRKIEPLEERAAESANGMFCDVIGEAYVKRHFPGTHKHEVQKLAEDVCQAFLKRLAGNSWMSAPSRKFAQEKLRKIIVNIGYSGLWTDYGLLDLSDDNPAANVLKTNSMRRKIAFALLRQKPNRRRLHIPDESAQRVNAWTYPNLLNANYPAAILQPPFYDHEASFAYNLGALGSVIGHELTHNFDDQGSRHDQEGNLNLWLSEKEQKAFKAAAVRLIDKANEHCPVPAIQMKGDQVIGELIADLGGLEIVMDVIRAKYRDKKARLAAMRTVFIAQAFHFARHSTPEDRIMQAKAGVHPDNIFRVNGILPHCDDFYEAFNMREGDKLYIPPEERAKIW